MKTTALKALLLLGMHAILFAAYGQSDVRKVEVSTLPEAIRSLNDITLALRWTDSVGVNVVVTTQNLFKPLDDPDYLPEQLARIQHRLPSGRYPGRDFYKLASAPSVYHFLLRNDSALLWRKVDGDGVGCVLKAKGNRVKSSVVVTDLDKDRVAELWFIIKAVCNEDNAPNEMKMIMYTANQRFVVSGTSVWKGDGEPRGGRYYLDAALQNGPEEFRRYAVFLWKRHAQN